LREPSGSKDYFMGWWAGIEAYKQKQGDSVTISRKVAEEWVGIITMLAKDNNNQIEAWNSDILDELRKALSMEVK
jgi:hypothetical protein